MKIAIAVDDGRVTEHFGHCDGFLVYNIEDGKTANKEMIPNPGHKPGFLPLFLHERGISTIISGGMGGAAADIFKENGIEVFLGAKGSADQVIEDFLAGKLGPSSSVCRDHDHQ